MSEIDITVVVHIRRADGSSTRISETAEYPSGDNPRSETSEVEAAIAATARLVVARTL